MGVPKVEGCCCCCSLETGGLIIGWWNLVWNIIIFLIFLPILMVGLISDCGEAKRMLENHSHYSFSSEEFDVCKAGKIVVVLVLLALFVVVCGLAVISIFCIRGIMTRNHKLIIPLMVLYAINAMLYFLSIISFDPTLIVFSFLRLLLELYLLDVLYSVYDKLKLEQEHGGVISLQTLEGRP